MTVRELIEKLENCNPEFTVYLEGISSDIEVNEFEDETVHLYRTDD